MIEVAIIRTGVANLASVVAAFERLGARAVVTTDPARIRDASHVMLPGVGAFGAGIAALDAAALRAPLCARIAADQPTIAICLGLQLLAGSSDETPGVVGLGVLPAHVARFSRPAGSLASPGLLSSAAVKVPQLGWNRVSAPDGARFLESGYAYFANSYRLGVEAELAGWRVATADHGGPFVAAIERGRVLGCQFHPELSGPWGMRLLTRWLEVT